MVFDSILSHPTAFIHMPELSAAGMVKMLFGPEIKAYNWVHSFFTSSDAHAGGGEWKLVDYYAASCPHCVKLAPVWDDVKNVWSALESRGEVPHVNFIKKECYGDNWVPGKDDADCKLERIQGFPTLKLFGPKGSVLFDHGARDVAGIVDFVKEQTVGKAAAAAADVVPMPKEPTMVDYFAASCGHCKNLSPAWDKASHDFHGVAWQKKECLDAKWQPGKDFDECRKAHIQGFPTIRLLANGNAVDYEGDRSADSLTQFAKDHVHKSNGEQHAGAVAVDAPAGPTEPTMVDYFAASCPHCKHLNPAWEKAAHEFQGVAWQQKECLNDKWQPGKDFEECNKANIEGFPTIKMFANGKTHEYQGDRSAESLVKFAKDHAEQTVGKAAAAAADVIPMPKEPTMVDYFAASCGHCKNLSPAWDKASHDFHGVAWQKKECLDAKWQPGKDFDECRKAHIQGFPTIRLLANGKAVDYEGDRSADSLTQFAKDHVHKSNGEQHPEAVAVDAPTGPTEPTMVDYFAASCPHCKHLNPAWEKAAHEFQGVAWQQKECLNDKWQPGKDFDECNKANIEGFPTIKMFANGKIHEYQGDRSAESLVKFAKDYAGAKKTDAMTDVPEKESVEAAKAAGGLSEKVLAKNVAGVREMAVPAELLSLPSSDLGFL